MIELISIHIPKTGGTSFYQVLQQVYGSAVSKSYKRRDYLEDCQTHSSFDQALSPTIRVLHGHLYYREIASLQEKHQSKVICWFRDPVERVISNYSFFKAGLNNPQRNPVNYQANKHRINETLVEYASKAENRNRMTDFLKGIQLEKLFFFGFLSSFDRDIQRLGRMLSWPSFEVARLNQSTYSNKKVFLEDDHIRSEIAKLNQLDMKLFEQAQALAKQNS